MSRVTWTVTAAAVLWVTAAGPAAAQTTPLPDGVAAQVGQEPITEREFRHWLRIGIRGEGPESAPLDPPSFRRCVAAELRRVPEGEPMPSRRALRRRCRDRYDALRDSTLRFLLNGVWVRQEAVARDIRVTPQAVRGRFERQKREAFPTERAFRRFLRSSGLTRGDLLTRVELDMLQQRLTRAVTAGVPEVTRQEVERYYARHQRRYRDLSPAAARRSIRALLTSRRQQRALERFVAGFRSRYRARTVCANGYVVPECSNAPGP
jgi:hypothetical protein